MEDVGGVAGVDDAHVAAGFNYVGKGAGRDGRSLLAFVFRCAGPLVTRRKGTGWKTSVVSWVSMMPMLPRVSIMSERVLDEMDGRCWPLFLEAQLLCRELLPLFKLLPLSLGRGAAGAGGWASS